MCTVFYVYVNFVIGQAAYSFGRTYIISIIHVRDILSFQTITWNYCDTLMNLMYSNISILARGTGYKHSYHDNRTG